MKQDTFRLAVMAFVIAFIIGAVLTLLCGAAQACDKIANFTGEPLRLIHPDSVVVWGELNVKIVHRRRWRPDDWCVGRINATGRYVGKSVPGTLYQIYDTTWVLCCDSAARGMRKLSDEAAGKSKLSAHDTLRYNFYLDSVCVADNLDGDQIAAMKRAYALLFDCPPDSIQHPECWYIKSVDTVWMDLRYSWQGDRWALVDDWQDFTIICGTIMSIDTTWIRVISDTLKNDAKM